MAESAASAVVKVYADTSFLEAALSVLARHAKACAEELAAVRLDAEVQR